jgi:uncharacterized protein (DUF58 family)
MLTAHGRLAVAVGVVFALVGVIVGYPTITAIGLLGPLLVVGALLITRVRPQLVGSIELSPERALPNRPVTVALTVTNRADGPTSALELELPAFGTRSSVAIVGLEPEATVRREITLRAPGRGLYSVGPLSVSVSDPFGLTRRVAPVAPAQAFTVLPRRAVVGLPPTPGRRDLDGTETDRAVAGSITFHSLRDYVPGDERRHVHWPTYARTNKLMVKQFEDTSQFRTVVLLDPRAASYARTQDFETAIEIAASLVESSLDRGAPTELRIGEAFISGRSAAEVTRFLDLLASTEASEAEPGLAYFGSFSTAEVGGNVICVTGPTSPMVRRSVSEVARQFDDVAMIEVRHVDDRSSTVQRTSGMAVFVCASLEQFVILWDTSA